MSRFWLISRDSRDAVVNITSDLNDLSERIGATEQAASRRRGKDDLPRLRKRLARRAAQHAKGEDVEEVCIDSKYVVDVNGHVTARQKVSSAICS